jgi:hypothetical protein
MIRNLKRMLDDERGMATVWTSFMVYLTVGDLYGY